jgi:hypothetical protein
MNMVLYFIPQDKIFLCFPFILHKDNPALPKVSFTRAILTKNFLRKTTFI